MQRRDTPAYEFPGYGDLAKLAQDSRSGLKALNVTVLTTSRIPDVDKIATATEARFNRIGIGALQASSKTRSEQAVWITLILAEADAD